MVLDGFYFVDEYVAVSPMPGRWLLPVIAREFRVVVSAVEDYELEYDPGLLEGRVEYLRVPIPDYGWPSLWQLLRVARTAAAAAGRGWRVLIHCAGGLGRSATLAAGYLVYRYRIPARRAVEMVRAVRGPGAVESRGQEGVLRGFEAALLLGEDRLEGIAARDTDGRLGEALRLAGMLAEALTHSGLAGLHGARELLEAVLAAVEHREPRGWARGVAATIAELVPDAGRIASLDLEEAGRSGARRSYILRATCTGYSEHCESLLDRLARELAEAQRVHVASVDVEAEYE